MKHLWISLFFFYSHISLASADSLILKKVSTPEKIFFGTYYPKAYLETENIHSRLRSVLVEISELNAPQKRTKRISICFKGNPEFIKELQTNFQEKYKNENLSIEEEGGFIKNSGNEYYETRIIYAIFPLESAEFFLNDLPLDKFNLQEKQKLEELFDYIKTIL